MIEKIYFDMDGVLADFDRGVKEFCGMQPLQQGGKRSEEEDNKMWMRIREVEHFYDKLEPMPGALEMFQKIYEKYGDHCEILTGIPKPKRGILTSGEDKTAWARRLLSKDLVVNIVYREEKKNFCKGKDWILIDDHPGNIASWREYGGTGILHVSAEDTIRQLQEMGIL